MNDLLVILPIVFPLFAAVIMLFSWKHLNWRRYINTISSFILLVLTLILFAEVNKEGIVATQIGGWPAPFGITIVADLFSALMVVISAVIGFTTSIYSLSSIDRKKEFYFYYSLLQLLQMGINGAFLAGDMFNLYVWFEVMLISSFVLIAMGGEKPQLEGSIKYVTINIISSVFVLSGIGLLYSITGSLNMADIASTIKNFEEQQFINIVSIFFLVSFGIKSAIFPLFFWLPASYHTPPSAVSAIFAGMLTKVGVYALIRTFVMVLPVSDDIFTLLLIISGLTMFIGVVGASIQNEFRKILSFHIISQIGYMIMGFALNTAFAIAASIFYILHHIIVKVNLFYISGIVNKLAGSYELKKIGGIYKYHPYISILFLISAMSLAGIPPLSGFWGKYNLIVEGLRIEEYLIVGVSLVVGLLTLFSMTKIWNEVFWKEKNKDEEIEVKRKINKYELAAMVAPAIILASITIVIGIYVQPFIDFAMRAADQLVNPSEYIRAVIGR